MQPASSLSRRDLLPPEYKTLLESTAGESDEQFPSPLRSSWISSTAAASGSDAIARLSEPPCTPNPTSSIKTSKAERKALLVPIMEFSIVLKAHLDSVPLRNYRSGINPIK
jgi:hypothetical protein